MPDPRPPRFTPHQLLAIVLVLAFLYGGFVYAVIHIAARMNW